VAGQPTTVSALWRKEVKRTGRSWARRPGVWSGASDRTRRCTPPGTAAAGTAGGGGGRRRSNRVGRRNRTRRAGDSSVGSAGGYDPYCTYCKSTVDNSTGGKVIDARTLGLYVAFVLWQNDIGGTLNGPSSKEKRQIGGGMDVNRSTHGWEGTWRRASSGRSSRVRGRKS